MITEFRHESVEEEIQIYRNDFYSGVMRLVRKLFML